MWKTRNMTTRTKKGSCYYDGGFCDQERDSTRVGLGSVWRSPGHDFDRSISTGIDCKIH